MPDYEYTYLQAARKGPAFGYDALIEEGWKEVPEDFTRDDYTDNYVFRRLKEAKPKKVA